MSSPKKHKKKIENLLAWSITRDKLFRECRLSYWYRHIGFWGGWSWGASPQTRAIYRATKLATVPAITGIAVHRAIRKVLASARARVPVDLAREAVRMEMAVAGPIIISQCGSPNKWGKDYVRLLENETGRHFNTEEIVAFGRRAREIFETFCRQTITKRLLGDPSPILTRYLDQGIPKVSYVLGVPALVAPDLVVRSPRGLEIVDWKTGQKSPRDWLQVAVYDLYVRASEALSDDVPTRVHCAYMANDDVEPHELKPLERETARQHIQDSFANMQELSDDPRINTAPADRFPACPGRHCGNCNFQKLCPHSAAGKSDEPIPASVDIDDEE